MQCIINLFEYWLERRAITGSKAGRPDRRMKNLTSVCETTSCWLFCQGTTFCIVYLHFPTKFLTAWHHGCYSEPTLKWREIVVVFTLLRLQRHAKIEVVRVSSPWSDRKMSECCKELLKILEKCKKSVCVSDHVCAEIQRRRGRAINYVDHLT